MEQTTKVPRSTETPTQLLQLGERYTDNKTNRANYQSVQIDMIDEDGLQW